MLVDTFVYHSMLTTRVQLTPLMSHNYVFVYFLFHIYLPKSTFPALPKVEKIREK